MLTESKLNRIIRNAINEAVYQGKDIDKHFKDQQKELSWKIKEKHQKDFNGEMSNKADDDENKNIRNDKHMGKQALKVWDKADEERKKQVSESKLNHIIKESIKMTLNEMCKPFEGMYEMPSEDTDMINFLLDKNENATVHDLCLCAIYNHISREELCQRYPDYVETINKNWDYCNKEFNQEWMDCLRGGAEDDMYDMGLSYEND